MPPALRCLAAVVLLSVVIVASWIVLRTDADTPVPAAPASSIADGALREHAIGLEAVESEPRVQAAIMFPSKTSLVASPAPATIEAGRAGRVTGDSTHLRSSDEPEILLRIESPSGEPVPKARIEIVQHCEGEDIRSVRRASREGLARWRFARAGSFDIVARDPLERFGFGTIRGLVAGQQEIAVRLGELHEIAVDAYEFGGDRLERFAARLVASDERDDDLEKFARRVTRRPSGRLSLVIDRPEFYVQVIGERHALCELGPFHASSAPASVEARLARNGGVQGRVLAEGVPVAGVRVSLHAATSSVVQGFPTHSEQRAKFETTTASDGTFDLSVRCSGRFYLRANESHFAPAELGPFDLDPELTLDGLVLELTEGATITGMVRLPEGVQLRLIGVSASRGDGFVAIASINDDDQFRFARLMPGRWNVQVRRYGWPSGEVAFFENPAGGVNRWSHSFDVAAGKTIVSDFDLRGVSADAAELPQMARPYRAGRR